MLGQDGQQLLLKIGSFYHRVHPCRIILTGDICNKDLNDQASELPAEINPRCKSNSCIVDVEIESDEGDIDNHIPENSQGVSETSTISRIGQVCDSNTQLDCSQSGSTTKNTKTVVQIPKVKQVIKYQLPGSETCLKLNCTAGLVRLQGNMNTI